MADSKKPHFIVQCVGEYKGRENWTRVGAAWRNEKKKDTISIVISPGVSVTGKLVLMPYVDELAGADDNSDFDQA